MKIIQIIVTAALLIFLTMSNVVIAHASEKNNTSKRGELTVLTSDAGKVVMQFHQAIQGGDKSKARGFLADDVIIYEGGRVERSADDYANHHMLADMKYLAQLKVEILEHEVREMGETAYSISKTKLTGEFQGKDVKSEGMESMILMKKNGKWKIVHIHWSH
jgi:ketosteroid isomerase-like protein|tara:strand:+ start:64 stop:549 length:486 start_codon:yes stop_codon:yes gene_type:complete